MEESTSSTHYFSIFTNYPLISAVTAFTIAQFIKLFASWYRERRWDLKQLVGSGGMPSSHSATITALALAIGLQESFGGSHFAIAFILASVVMYDATGVRVAKLRFSIRLYTNFLQNIRWQKADHCVNFSVIPLPRSLPVECLEV